MRGHRTLLTLLLLIAAFAMLAAETARADLLLLRDGRRVVTRGPWEVTGDQVVYTSPIGRVTSIALAEVDLAASRAASRTAAPPPRAAGAGIKAEKGEKIVLYATSWCPWCRKTRELLDELDVAWEERDVEADAAAALDQERLAPGSGVPLIVYGDRILRGYSESAIREIAAAARRNGATGGGTGPSTASP